MPCLQARHFPQVHPKHAFSPGGGFTRPFSPRSCGITNAKCSQSRHHSPDSLRNSRHILIRRFDSHRRFIRWWLVLGGVLRDISSRARGTIRTHLGLRCPPFLRVPGPVLRPITPTVIRALTKHRTNRHQNAEFQSGSFHVQPS